MRMHGRRNCRNNAIPLAAMMAAGRGWDGFSSWSFDGNGGPGGRGGRRGPKGRRRVFGQGELRLILLKLIGDESRHGYQLIKAIGETTGGTYEPSPGAVYPTLQMLADEGAIKEAASAKGEEAKRGFAITEAGQAELDERTEEIDAINARLTAMSGAAERDSAPELFRAMGNLTRVLKNKYRQGGFDQKGLEEIVDIIDEAAKRIERI